VASLSLAADSTRAHGTSITRSYASAWWHAAATTSGQAGYPAPDLVNPSDLDDAIDCDLALCPVTNTMPIRRLSLRDRAVPATALVMAWVDMPMLQVVRSDQT
jgi:hypothetical protein